MVLTSQSPVLRRDRCVLVSSLPGRMRRRLLNSHISQLFSEVLTENCIAISQQVA
jgi:hypothetical protein